MVLEDKNIVFWYNGSTSYQISFIYNKFIVK